MHYLSNLILVFIGGIFLAIQSGFNAKLGVLLQQPFLAVVFSLGFSAIISVLILLAFGVKIPSLSIILQVPWYFWVAGPLLSVAGLGLYFYTIPKLGVSSVVAIGICGQLLVAAIAGHYQWLGFPKNNLGVYQYIGLSLMVLGVFLNQYNKS